MLLCLALLALYQLKHLHSEFSLPSTQKIFQGEEESAKKEEEVEDPPGFKWADIVPTRTLTWHPCFDSPLHDCARLDVPMDWIYPSESERVVLAVIRIRAQQAVVNGTSSSSSSDYRGPVFFNPGGPGGSGVWSLLHHGKELQAILGAEKYDLITFDPRGIGSSVPRIECWTGRSSQERTIWELQDVGTVDAHPGTVYDAFSRAKVFSKICDESNEQLGGILEHSSTAYHARDMLEILEQMGETRLKYWGFSYGTILGGTFAAMYPDRVERMVNDGNVDYEEWYRGTQINFNHDTDKVLEAFFSLCHSAGPLRCAFYSLSPAQIKTRLSSLLSAIRHAPVVYYPLDSNSSSPSPPPEIITYSKLRKMISTALYQPIFRFPKIANVLAALEVGNGRTYYEYTSSPENTGPFPSLCFSESLPPSIPLSRPEEGTADAYPAIMCSDSPPSDILSSPSAFADYASLLQNMSYAAGAVQAAFQLSCVGRSLRPKWRFPGIPEQEKVKTHFPVLFVNNFADNVTPLVSARNNSGSFEGSVVLVQNSYGHTTLAAPSVCTARKIREYFQLGKLPGENERVCEGDGLPFDDVIPEDIGEDDEGDELVHAVRKMRREGVKIWVPFG
ncbi:Alpha/Beta hydrolase protein [Podospora australis]|uniref:Alpha/Beta hydrolase protein n=1 Tax=Podospora australis TaxID=1536484 RepID=A0AAN6X5B9_9PEZI|nr:Alpha/Beta hydrolase protein [Podospora australis]